MLGAVGGNGILLVPQHTRLWAQRAIHQMLMRLEFLKTGGAGLQFRPPLWMFIDSICHGPADGDPAFIAALSGLAFAIYRALFDPVIIDVQDAIDCVFPGIILDSCLVFTS
eukprot:Skav206117  [mRNA]  locus=scaffold172:92745:97730:- [translate_table: standard]